MNKRDREVWKNMTDQVERQYSLEKRIEGYKQIHKRKNAPAFHCKGARISIWEAEEKLEKLVDEMKHEKV